MSFIARLRELPPYRRKRAALYISAGLTLLILVLWVALPGGTDTHSGIDIAPLFDEFGQTFGEQMDRLKSGFNETVGGFKNFNNAATSSDMASTTEAASTTQRTATTTP